MDFVGFGRSDKFVEREAYSFKMHHDTLVGFIEKLALQQITLVVHDWGGPIGLTAASEMAKRFPRLVIMNTLLATGEEQMTETWLWWRMFVEQTPDLPIGRVIRGGTVCGDKIAPEIIAGYEAPFPDKSCKAGAVTWPLLIPLHPDDPGASEMLRARTVLSKWREPVLVMFSDSDPYTRGFETYFCRLIPTVKERIVVKDAGHFLQEDKVQIAGTY